MLFYEEWMGEWPDRKKNKKRDYEKLNYFSNLIHLTCPDTDL